MVWPPPVSTRPHTLFPSPALFRSGLDSVPNSSRNRVPPSASSKRPTRALVAPVKAHASWPNSSASIKVSGSAAQFMMTSGPSQQIGRAHVLTPVTNAHLVCRLLLEKKKQHTAIHVATVEIGNVVNDDGIHR